MSIEKPEFAYACRRSREEMVRAINARSDAVASSHRNLSRLHAMRAATMMSCTVSMVDGGDCSSGTLLSSAEWQYDASMIPIPAETACAPAILIVDDDQEIQTLLAQSLAGQGYRVDVAADARQMDRMLANATFDLVLLDIMMPGEDGVSACRRITLAGGPAVILLSGLDEERDRVDGLESGAGHYLTKPCSAREILATVRAALRERNAIEPVVRRTYDFLGWRMDIIARELIDPAGVLVGVTDGEFALLRVLVERPRRVLSRELILETARGPQSESFDRAIDVQISRLRRKLRTQGDEIIRTVRNEGYMFVPTVVRS